MTTIKWLVALVFVNLSTLIWGISGFFVAFVLSAFLLWAHSTIKND